MMEYLSQVTGWIAANADSIRSTIAVLSPVLSSYITWKVAKYSIRQDGLDRSRRQISANHTETAQQTEALTHRFQAIFDASQALNADLKREMGLLRKEAAEWKEEAHDLREEVIRLRKLLDRYRTVCAGCPKIVDLIMDDTHA